MAPLEIGTLYYVEEAIYKAEKAKFRDVSTVSTVSMCVLCAKFTALGPMLHTKVQALVTAKFAGLSMPTKKFDPQKDGWCAEMSSSKATVFFCIVFISVLFSPVARMLRSPTSLHATRLAKHLGSFWLCAH